MAEVRLTETEAEEFLAAAADYSEYKRALLELVEKRESRAIRVDTSLTSTVSWDSGLRSVFGRLSIERNLSKHILDVLRHWLVDEIAEKKDSILSKFGISIEDNQE
jgi:hypothetical protein